uniref:Uncharacterized protein n=1 Tax=Phytophthora ramorum TaxID=164328 RepID=H3GJ04_PHYRM
MKRKRQRSESFQGGDDDARERLASFHARMFELPQEEATAVAPETPRVLFKSKHKKQKKNFADDGEPVPMVKFVKNKVKKEKKPKEKKKVVEKKGAAGARVVTVPGMSNAIVKKQEKTVALVVQDVKKKKVKTKKKKQQDSVEAVKMTKVPVQAPWHAMKKDEDHEEDNGVDPLEQALRKMKEIATQQIVKPPHKKQKSAARKAVAVSKMEKAKESVGAFEKKNDALQPATDSNNGSDPHAHPSKTKIKKLKKKRKELREKATCGSNHTSGSSASNSKGVQNDLPAVTAKSAGADLIKKNTSPSDTPAPSPKSRKKRKKSPEATSLNSVSPKTLAPAQPRRGKTLIVSDDPERQSASTTNASGRAPVVASKKAKTSKIIGTAAVEEEPLASTKQLTPIAASLAEDAKKKDDMFLPAHEAPRQPQVAVKQVHKAMVTPYPAKKAVAAPVIQLSDESSSDSDEGGDFDIDHNDGHNASLYTRLIDSAARERWELVEVGRLVRLFAAEWSFKESKTARFLCETCPELVNVDFLEGLGINLSAEQLVQIFEAGSGNSGVVMNKMASAVENGHLSVRDPSFVSALERRFALMESNGEVMELMHPLLESLSTVRDVGCLLKQLCEHWQLERKIALVQQVLLSNVFDDLDGNQDEILVDLPDLIGRLDFPSRLDQEDVDENGNLKGFLANEDSEFSGEEGSEEEIDEDDSEVDEDPFEGESDSEEEVEIAGRSRGRNRFIEDEADVGEEDEEEEGEEDRHDDDSSSDSD